MVREQAKIMGLVIAFLRENFGICKLPVNYILLSAVFYCLLFLYIIQTKSKKNHTLGHISKLPAS